jgi:hypothetical protein
MERVDCAACGSSDSERLFSAPDFSSDTLEKFNLVRCAECELVFVDPRPDSEELGGYYRPEYYGKKNAKFGGFF